MLGNCAHTCWEPARTVRDIARLCWEPAIDTENDGGSDSDMLEMCARCARDVREACSRCAQDVLEMCSTYAQNMRKTCSRCAREMCLRDRKMDRKFRPSSWLDFPSKTDGIFVDLMSIWIDGSMCARSKTHMACSMYATLWLVLKITLWLPRGISTNLLNITRS
jgi:hypothetical protein